MRGRKMFNEILKEKSLIPSERRGRSNKLIANRNECLIARYFYHGFCKNKCYEEIIRTLVSEFFLSQSTIGQIIINNSEKLQTLKQRGIVLYYFQTKWPHFKW